MKNTVKKILAMAFAVVMICALMVPAFASSTETIDVTVRVLNKDKNWSVEKDVTVKVASANVKYVLNQATGLKFAYTTAGAVKSVTYGGATVANGAFDLLDTDKWVVAVNGKAVTDALSNVALEKGDVVTVYYADTTLGTKLIERDDSRIAEGIVSFYYYDANGNMKPLTGAKVVLKKGGEIIPNKLATVKADVVVTDDHDETVTSKVISYSAAPDGVLHEVTTYVNVTEKADVDAPFFTTDEKGQIWIDPSVLALTASGDVELVVADMSVSKLTTKSDDDDVKALYNKQLAKYPCYFEDATADKVIAPKGMYDVAGNTGDMTIAYVLVACAAVITLGAVVVMKKKVSAK